MSSVEIVIVVVASVLTSYFTTKIITTYYFKIIDGYVKGLFEDIKEKLR